jgi:hypothetical protein
MLQCNLLWAWRCVVKLWRYLKIGVLCLSVAGCLMPPEVIPVDTGAPPPTVLKLDGILSRSQATPTGMPIRVFFTHGMGTGETEYCALAPLMTHLVSILKLRQQSVAQPFTTCDGLAVAPPRYIGAPGTPFRAQLYTYDFVQDGSGRRVQFTFLLWAPLTQPINATVAETGHPSWALLTSAAKSFMQTHLSDVVLYGGTYRQIVRPVVEQALCFFVGGSPDAADARSCQGGDPDQETVLITHSLGGYILMDAVANLRAVHPAGRNALAGTDAAAKLLKHTDLVFMLANQLALLDMTTLTQYPPPSAPPAAGAPTAQLESNGVLAAFRRHWHDHFAGARRPRQIVAVSDPNDILSYLVSAGNVSIQDENMIIANVYLGVARNWFDLFAWPPSAHLNYLTNDDVMDIIACGMTGNSIEHCGG